MAILRLATFDGAIQSEPLEANLTWLSSRQHGNSAQMDRGRPGSGAGRLTIRSGAARRVLIAPIQALRWEGGGGEGGDVSPLCCLHNGTAPMPHCFYSMLIDSWIAAVVNWPSWLELELLHHSSRGQHCEQAQAGQDTQPPACSSSAPAKAAAVQGEYLGSRTLSLAVSSASVQRLNEL